MTGGVVVVLGTTGRNVGAGMTGGIIFLLDEKDEISEKINHEIISIYDLSNQSQEDILIPPIQSHFEKTKSQKAKKILSNWKEWKKKFRILVPPSEKVRLGIEKFKQ